MDTITKKVTLDFYNGLEVELMKDILNPQFGEEYIIHNGRIEAILRPID